MALQGNEPDYQARSRIVNIYSFSRTSVKTAGASMNFEDSIPGWVNQVRGSYPGCSRRRITIALAATQKPTVRHKKPEGPGWSCNAFRFRSNRLPGLSAEEPVFGTDCRTERSQSSLFLFAR